MCLIAHRKGHGLIPTEVITHNLVSNPDGFGLMWREGATHSWAKFAPNQGSQFAAALQILNKNKGMEFAAHFRTATHGACTKELSHPFAYQDSRGKEVLVMHNGIIDIETHKDPKESDTSMFVRAVLARLPDQWWRRDHYVYLVEKAIGWSRMLIMSGKEVIRLNEEDWEQKDGIWYSTKPMFSMTKPTTTTVVKPRSIGEIIDDNAEFERSYGVRSIPSTTEWRDDEADYAGYKDSKTGWITNEGHNVTITSRIGDVSEETSCGDIICTDCETNGEFYVYGKKAYLDIKHFPGPPALPITVIGSANTEKWPLAHT